MLLTTTLTLIKHPHKRWHIFWGWTLETLIKLSHLPQNFATPLHQNSSNLLSLALPVLASPSSTSVVWMKYTSPWPDVIADASEYVESIGNVKDKLQSGVQHGHRSQAKANRHDLSGIVIMSWQACLKVFSFYQLSSNPSPSLHQFTVSLSIHWRKASPLRLSDTVLCRMPLVFCKEALL